MLAEKENRMTQLKSAFFLLAFLSFPALSDARPVPAWPYEKLFKQSDLVVIAHPTESVDVKDRMKENPMKIDFMGINTTLKIVHVAKGNLKSSNLTFLHYRIGPDQLIINGPSLVSFRMQGIRYTVENGPRVELTGPATYLLFLKKRDDGRYEAVTGQFDPVFSVKELTAPIEGGISQQPDGPVTQKSAQSAAP
jgi:hypothetical protein